ncbi:MAG: hypothetical protein QM698_13655 [Micropepsaceae bacterium]
MTLHHRLTAFNTATESENKIHDDAVASRFGFTGGLVPGVDVFAYMAHAPIAIWGEAWLSGGGMQARFGKPVYDGDDTLVTGEADGTDRLTLTASARGVTCATGTAWKLDDAPEPASIGTAELPDYASRPKASMESLKPGQILGTMVETYTKADGAQHLADVREPGGPFENGAICNPGWLVRRANYILGNNVKLGPWIHVESRIRNHARLRDGEPAETRAIVVENVESKGHLIVTLDFEIVSGARRIMSGRHWAIYEPRQVRERS